MDIGVIGIGNIGLGLAQRLIDRGHGVNVRDLRKVPERIAAKSGARVLPTPAAVAESCELLIIAVVDAAQVDEVLCGPGGVLSAPPVDVMICSTIAPAEVERFARLVRARGAELLDAPVSGGPLKARNGTLSLMLACAEAARLRHSAVLADLAERLCAFPGAQECCRVRGRRRDAALIDHAVILFLDLDKDAPAVRRDAVAAHAQLFLIDGLFERRANQAVVVGIIINVADGVLAVRVLFHIGRHPLQ